MKKLITLFMLAVCLLTVAGTSDVAAAQTRIKDIAKVQGVRSNQLTGYGLVVGLNGTGDSNKMTQTIQSLGNMLKNYGVVIDTNGIKPKNIATVMVTATLPPFVREGDTIDITVSSIGDASSIQGGTLIQTPLLAANGNVYAVAQGAVSTGGFSAGRGGNSSQKNFPTVGLCPNGAIVERSVEDDLSGMNTLSLSLNRSDFTTASRVAQVINSNYGNIAVAANPGRIDINVPAYQRRNIVGFIAGIEDLSVTPDNIAKVIVNERTGTIVMGGNVSVDTVAITQGGLSINIKRTDEVSQPDPFSLGKTVTTRNEDVDVSEDQANSIILPATSNINDIVGALNAVGATPRDIISILQSMKAAGAIHAELEII